MNKKEFKKLYGEARKSLREACRIGVEEILKWREINAGKPAYEIAFSKDYYHSRMWHNIHFKGDKSPRIAMKCNVMCRSRNVSPSRNGFGPSSDQFCYCGVKP